MRAGRPCSGCLPGRLGRCRNSGQAPRTTSDQVICDGGSLSSVSVSAAPASSLRTVSQPPVNTTAVNTTGDSRSSSASLLPVSSSSSCSLIGALPTLDSILSMKTPTLHHVPKGVRDSWAQIVGDALSAVVSSPSDVSVWCKLFMLARCILVSPPRGGRSHWRATLKLVRSPIQKWKDGGFLDLWSEVIGE